MKIKYKEIIAITCIGLMACQKPMASKNNATELEKSTDSLNSKETKVEKKEIVLDTLKQKNKIDQSVIKEEEKPLVYEFSKEELLGKINPAKNLKFSKIEKQFTHKVNIYMRKKAYLSFKEMFMAAKKDGINLKIVSATRPFNHQKSIWNRKWNGKYAKVKTENRAKEILKWSSMPGTSRHHWGTDIDLISLNNSYFEKGSGLKTYKWLQQNAKQYGFCQVYTEKNDLRPNGYNMEKWHWSYIPVASKMLEEYNKQIKYSDINGFNGDKYANNVEAIANYVNGVACH